MEKKPRLCAECGKHFKPMSDKLWNAVLYGHRRASLKHSRDEEYVKRITSEYEAGRDCTLVAYRWKMIEST